MVYAAFRFFTADNHADGRPVTTGRGLNHRHAMLQDPYFPDCPVRNIIARVADKWSLLVMHTLKNHPEPMRFSELLRALPDISQKMLTSTLRRHEADGFLVRRSMPKCLHAPPTRSRRGPNLSWKPAGQWWTGPSTILQPS